MLDKIERLAEIKQNRHYRFDIEVDGGVNVKTAHQIVQAGATVLVAGAAISTRPKAWPRP